MQSVRSCALGDVGRVLLTLIGGILNWVVVGVGGFGDGLEVRRIGGCNWWCQFREIEREGERGFGEHEREI